MKKKPIKAVKSPKAIEKLENKAILAVAKFLEAKGFKVLVAGFSGVEQGSAKFNFRLIYNFTGKLPLNK